jgi:hypothetical protein
MADGPPTPHLPAASPAMTAGPSSPLRLRLNSRATVPSMADRARRVRGEPARRVVSSSALLPPSSKSAVPRCAMTCSFVDSASLLGGESPPNSPVRIERISPGHRVASVSGGICRLRGVLYNPWSEPICGQSGAGGNRTPCQRSASVLIRGYVASSTVVFG